MVVLRSADAEADRRGFAAKGLGDLPRFDFARKGVREGREVEVAFSLAFARSPALPEAGFFVCEQKRPENFWDAAAQVHPNGATGVAELAFVHPEPEAARGFLSGFLGAEAEAAADGFGFSFALENARVTCITPAGYAAGWGAAAPGGAGWAGMRIATPAGALALTGA